MARASVIYVVRYEDQLEGNTVVAAFTVKYEAIDWARSYVERGILDKGRLYVEKWRDAGRFGGLPYSTYIDVIGEEELYGRQASDSTEAD